MKKILIIGGAGYIGTILTDHLLSAGHQVRSIDLFLYKNNHCVLPYLGREGYESKYGDLCDDRVLNNVLEGITDVVLLAGLVGDPITKKYPEASHAINDVGIKNCIDQLNGKSLDHLVFVSTCSNYGLIEGDQLADEDFELKPLSLYAKSKVATEKYIMGLKGKVDYTPTILRFATAFGLSTRMRFDLTVSEFTRELVLGRELLVYDANTWRPYCHVRDFGRLIDKVIKAPAEHVAFEVFNAGGNVNNYTKQRIVDAVLEQIPKAKVKYKKHGVDPRNYMVDFSKVKRILDFEPKYTVPDGIKEVLDAFENHIFDHVEKQRSVYGNFEIQYTMK
uniref:Nucleoside-diphosphate-sugar epimerases n=1 Tax=uncultured delta proteobacterium HF0200_39N20 TaxID=710833 RepID=E0XUS6_9DELT|nr:nucleoside-diphosphate-sugar epimerases [uncultured delta proteobacterium HF0200_39N20]